MTAQVTISPYLTSNALGSFGIDWNGFIQGCALDSPAQRYRLAAGLLATTETIPMWGGVAISELVPTPGSTTLPNSALGTVVSRATVCPTGGGWQNAAAGATGQITGFSVFDQNYSAVNSPQSPVPLIGSGGQVNFYRFGSAARIPVQVAPSMGTLENAGIWGPVSWDFVNQQLVPGVAAYGADTVTNATWNSGTGVVDFTVTSGGELAVGDWFTISGIVATGVGSAGVSYNGTFQAITGTATTTIAAQFLTGSANNPGTYSSGGSLHAGGGYLPVQVLDVNIGASMTVIFNSGTGFATWNRSGNAAIIQI